MRYPPAFERVLACFSRFQGIGRKTAERFVFDMLARWDQKAIEEFSDALRAVSSEITKCPDCHIHVQELPCPFCSKERHQQKELCVVATSKDAYAIEATHLFPGTFFVLGSTLSPLDERGIEPSHLDRLKARIQKEGITEVIFAFDSSLEGDATVSYLRDELKDLQIILSRLASGVPVGASLEFIDRGTLGRAFSGRQVL
jgi:recombination protein RecR